MLSSPSSPVHASSQSCVAAHTGHRYGRCTSELQPWAASMAGCVPFKLSWCMGPCRAPSFERLPVTAMPMRRISPWQRITARSMSHFLRGKSALQSFGLSLRLQCVNGTRFSLRVQNVHVVLLMLLQFLHVTLVFAEPASICFTRLCRTSTKLLCAIDRRCCFTGGTRTYKVFVGDGDRSQERRAPVVSPGVLILLRCALSGMPEWRRTR